MNETGIEVIVIVNQDTVSEIVRGIARIEQRHETRHGIFVFIFLFCLASGLLSLFFSDVPMTGWVCLICAFADLFYMDQEFFSTYSRVLKVYQNELNGAADHILRLTYVFYEKHMTITNETNQKTADLSYDQISSHHHQTMHYEIWTIPALWNTVVFYLPIRKKDVKKYHLHYAFRSDL
jgi:hypothetical protein